MMSQAAGVVLITNDRTKAAKVGYDTFIFIAKSHQQCENREWGLW